MIFFGWYIEDVASITKSGVAIDRKSKGSRIALFHHYLINRQKDFINLIKFVLSFGEVQHYLYSIKLKI